MGRAARLAFAHLRRRLVLWLLGALGPYLAVALLALGVVAWLWSAADAADGGLDPAPYREAARKVSPEGGDWLSLASRFALPWQIVYAVAYYGADAGRERPPADEIAGMLRPRLAFGLAPVTTVFRCGEDGEPLPEPRVVVRTVRVLRTADTYDGRFTVSWGTRARREGTDACPVEVVEPALLAIARVADWSRFDAAIRAAWGEEAVTAEERELVLAAAQAVATGDLEGPVFAVAWDGRSDGYLAGVRATEDVPPELVGWFELAGRRYGVPASVLMAIARIESGFRADAVGPPNYTGELAEGMMQFLPSTWARVGLDADGDGVASPFEPADAIVSAARYLAESGYRTDPEGAIYAYNHSRAYVSAVLRVAAEYRAMYGE